MDAGVPPVSPQCVASAQRGTGPRSARRRYRGPITFCTDPDFRREFEEDLVRRIIHRQQGLFTVPQRLRERQCSAGRRGVCDKDAVGECSYEAVSGVGQRDHDPFVLWLERRQNQQAAGGKGGLELRFKVHAPDAASRDPDHRLPTAEQDAQALPLHRRMESADQGAALVTHGGDGVEGLQDHPARALGRTEEARLVVIKEMYRASRPQCW